MTRTGSAIAGVTAAAGVVLVALARPEWREWLARPWSGATDHHIAGWAAWHGRLTVLGWAILMPLGTLAARYFKIWPGQDWPRRLDDRRWWHAHRLLQAGGIVVASAGVALAWRNAGGGAGPARAHALLGWTVTALGWSQIVGGLSRGSKGGPTDPRCRAGHLHGDHYAMTRRRIVFEWVHKAAGYLALALAAVAVALGLALVDAPRWMALTIGAWWTALAIAAVKLQHAGRCVDTYHAIWGPEPDLPGNRRRPIGLGVSRPAGGGERR